MIMMLVSVSCFSTLEIIKTASGANAAFRSPSPLHNYVVFHPCKLLCRYFKKVQLRPFIFNIGRVVVLRGDTHMHTHTHARTHTN